MRTCLADGGDGDVLFRRIADAPTARHPKPALAETGTGRNLRSLKSALAAAAPRGRRCRRCPALHPERPI